MMSINTKISLYNFKGGFMIIFKCNSTWRRLRKRIFTSLHITLSTTKLFYVNNTVCTYLATSTDSHYTDSMQHQNKQYFYIAQDVWIATKKNTYSL